MRTEAEQGYKTRGSWERGAVARRDSIYCRGGWIGVIRKGGLCHDYVMRFKQVF